MKTSVNLLLCMQIGFLAWSCEGLADCATREGDWVKVNLDIEPFSSVSVNQNIDVVIVPHVVQMVELEFGEHLIQEFSAKVSDDGLLELENLNSCNWMRSYRKPKVFLYTPTLSAINQFGFGNVVCVDTLFADNLNLEVKEGSGDVSLIVSADNFSVVSNGSSNITLSGKANIFRPSFYWNNGRLYAYHLQADKVILRHRGYNDLFVWANQEISGYIENEGHVYYKGSPSTILVEETWNGNLRPGN